MQQLAVVDHQVAETRRQVRHVLVIADHDVGFGRGSQAAVGVVQRRASERTGSSRDCLTAPSQWKLSWTSFKMLPHTTGGAPTIVSRIYGHALSARQNISFIRFEASPKISSSTSCARGTGLRKDGKVPVGAAVTEEEDDGDAAGAGWCSREADSAGVPVGRLRDQRYPGARRAHRRTGRSSTADRHPAAEPVIGRGAHPNDEAGCSQYRSCAGQRLVASAPPASYLGG